MKYLFSMPAGTEWILLFLLLGFFLVFPIAAVYYYLKCRRLTRELQSLGHKNNILQGKIVETV